MLYLPALASISLALYRDVCAKGSNAALYRPERRLL